MKDEAAVLTDFSRSISPKLAQCLAYQLGRLKNVTAVRVLRLPFPPTGAVSAVYRAVIELQTPNGRGTLLSDYVFFGQGRTEYEFTVIAPLGDRDLLTQFELVLAQRLLRRAATGTA